MYNGGGGVVAEIGGRGGRRGGRFRGGSGRWSGGERSCCWKGWWWGTGEGGSGEGELSVWGKSFRRAHGCVLRFFLSFFLSFFFLSFFLKFLWTSLLPKGSYPPPQDKKNNTKTKGEKKKSFGSKIMLGNLSKQILGEYL